MGYSLGGGIAPLFSARIITRFINLNIKNLPALKVVTFAGPRVGNKAWADYFGDLIKENKITFYPVINMHDPVPYVPSSFVYRYTIQEAVLVDFGPSLSRDSFFKLLNEAFNGKTFFGVGSGHILPDYIKAIREQW